MKDRGMRREKNGMWKGGRISDGKGYIKVLTPEHPNARGGYVFEHRLVMEKHLGRYLEANEIVHHLNENTIDNRIKNLKVMTKRSHDIYHIRERAKSNKGYTFDKARNKWYASISVDGKMRYLGRFDLEVDAKKKVLQARKLLAKLNNL